MKVVLISGKQGSGKTTITKSLIRRVGPIQRWYIKEFTFAETIYEIHNFARGYLRDLGFERPEKDGKLLQLLGTEWGRETIDQDIWVKCVRASIQKWEDALKALNMFAIVSDCRFKNELLGFPDALRVRLECPEIVRRERCIGWRNTTNHLSELDLDEYSEQKRFDLTLRTDDVNVEGCTELILHKLTANNWLEKRGPHDQKTHSVKSNPAP